jgi:ATP-dependent exoDNAse (exonuclease V) alpha subunit
VNLYDGEQRRDEKTALNQLNQESEEEGIEVARWEKNGNPCSRKQFPLRLAYAISIHKSQGMTLSKAILEFGASDFCRGLSFVAISRVRALSDIACLTRIGGQSLKKLGGVDKVAEDLHRRQRLPFHDVVNAALLGYHFND